MCDGCGCGEQDAGSRRVVVEQELLAKNDSRAAANRDHFRSREILALNLVSSPGSGKTTLLERTVHHLAPKVPVSVIEGDQQTTLDAERIKACGVEVVQLNTGNGCHLDAEMVHRAFHDLPDQRGGFLFIENVGNLVCPAAFDLGEAAKVVIVSVTEGEDKPLKYPAMFAAAAVCLVNKIDLLPYLDANLDKLMENARKVNRNLLVLPLSAKTGEGFSKWLDWLDEQRLAR